VLLLQIPGQAVGFDESVGFFSLFYEKRMIFIVAYALTGFLRLAMNYRLSQIRKFPRVKVLISPLLIHFLVEIGLIADNFTRSAVGIIGKIIPSKTVPK
jgi:hypothetical protein